MNMTSDNANYQPKKIELTIIINTWQTIKMTIQLSADLYYMKMINVDYMIGTAILSVNCNTHKKIYTLETIVPFLTASHSVFIFKNYFVFEHTFKCY